MIALGVIAAVWLTGRRLEASGAGTRDDASAMAVWAVTAGVIGARLYHVVTDWSSFENDLGRIPQIWRGGLGIPGGILFGTLGAAYAFRRRGIPVAVGLSAAAPALPLAQAIGRWGNWWNQELFGRPTTLPWALRIDNDKIPAPYPFGTTFHPTFLYESLWCLALCGVLLLIDRRYKLRPGRLFAMYVVGYSTGRFWIESLRIDPAHKIGGMRLNEWVALITGRGGTRVSHCRLDPSPWRCRAGTGRAGARRRGAGPTRMSDDEEPEDSEPVSPEPVDVGVGTTRRLRTWRRTSQSPKTSSQIFRNHWIEELAARHLGGGDEPGDAGTAPRRHDLDVEPRLRPVLPVGRALVEPHHVRQRLVVEAVESIEDVDQQCRQVIATRVVDRGEIGELPVRCEGHSDGKRRSFRNARCPTSRRVVATRERATKSSPRSDAGVHPALSSDAGRCGTWSYA